MTSDHIALFDFTSMTDLSTWTESSDTVRTPGMSKAALVLQKTQLFQRVVFFTLLNPQPNGAGFAGVRTVVDMDLSDYQKFSVKARGQGKTDHYKIVLRHNGQTGQLAYESIFKVNTSSPDFETIDIPFTSFKAYYRGEVVEDAEPLNLRKITMFGLQVFGGVYSEFKQSGAASLEIISIGVETI